MMKTVEVTHLRVAEDITELVGETPMLHLRRIVPATSADIYAKLEYLNPGGSVKDRAAIGIIKRAEEQGLLRKGSTAIEGTGGTFSGVARYIKEKNPKALAVAVEPQGSILQGGASGKHKTEGIGVSFIPKTWDPSLADQIIMVSDDDAFRTVCDLARKEGVLGGSRA